MLLPVAVTAGLSPVSPITPISEEDEDIYVSDLSVHTEQSATPVVPVHPIPQLQGPFEESISETSAVTRSYWVVDIDAQTRRRDLLENDEYERLCGRKWRQRSSEQYHPFWKLASQLVFGVHLLAKQLAISEPQVMKILQTHVNEMDGFLQRTTEDFLMIHLDVRTRIQYLNLPLENLDVFDQMLEDRNFRLSLISYNDQIEHAVDRFTLAITDAIRDLLKGKEAISVLWHYLIQLSSDGCFESYRLKAFYQAMMDNLEGWLEAFSKLRRRGAALQRALGQLAFAVTEMQRRVGVASRKDARLLMKTNKEPARKKSLKLKLCMKGSSSTNTTTPGSKKASSNKPLPRDPFLNQTKSQSRQAGDTEETERVNVGQSTTNATKRESNIPRALSRAKSCSALAMDSSSSATPPIPATPRVPGRLSRKLSKPFLPKRSASDGEKTDPKQNRPATAPARTLKSRSASIEQLKALWANNRPGTQQSMTKTPTTPRRGPSHQNSENEKSESMKEQISQFLKTDRVVEAWDSMAAKTGTCGRTISKTAKDWPCSIFRAKSPNAWRARAGDGTDLSGTDLGRQMSWVQDEPEVLNTYSFKQRPEMSPRIHVLSVQMTLDEELNTDEDIIDEIPNVIGGDSDSIITALPAVPPSTPATIPSVASEYRPRTIECAQG
ncbi:uncharacterized protein N7483_009066 [Penicillium malachiteum]|uniref:uncharacterized protein n=1 Tax=Penicillium malachiteum TaxID=1324776 RepID=UPI002549BF6E|nr:uncharacterized protein N7483_009066 [Penicillium malachiteum]KAJ5721132.1 hypothetical protein N7483_009066 [Penicillium malachiteum]